MLGFCLVKTSAPAVVFREDGITATLDSLALDGDDMQEGPAVSKSQKVGQDMVNIAQVKYTE